MDDLWIRLIERWRSLGIPIRAGASSSAIVAFEQRYHVLLPDDVRDYFLTADGTDEMDDDFLFRFWPLAEVKPVRDTWVGTRPNQYLPLSRLFRVCRSLHLLLGLCREADD